jgi:methyl-accepting chemotaxis protein
VRNLAERSAKAAKSTAELIESSGKQVQAGVAITNETEVALGEIVQNVVKVKDIVGEIAAASEEETRALAQISKAMSQVNSGAQSSSTQSEQLASTADELGGLAEQLNHEVARFQLHVQDRGNGDHKNYPMSHLTPEMIRVISELIQKQHPASTTVAETKPRTRPNKAGNGHDPISLDRDDRGYAQF